MSEKKLPFSEELVREIAAVYGTPFHLYDEKGISDNVKRLQKAFSWSSDFHEYFAVKATPQSVDYEKLKKTWRGCRLQFHGRIDFGGNGGNHRRGNCFFFQ